MGKGLIHVYTGDGKGKTTAAMGLAVRAVGQGFRVFIIQYMKGGAYTGEFITIKNFLRREKIDLVQYGKPCIKEQKQMKLNGFGEYHYFDHIRSNHECGDCRYCFLNDDQQKEFVMSAFYKTKQILESGDYDMVILDEINNAIRLGTLTMDNVYDILDLKPEHTELIFTGRGAPAKLIEKADLVTEMRLIKHYFNKGVNARRGIEY